MSDQLPLSDRVAAVLTAATTSGAVSALISEVAAEAGRLKVDLDAAEATSLDPLVPGVEAASASDRFVRLGLDVRRQQAALQALDRRSVEVTRAEEQAAARAARAAATKLRDEAVAAMRDRYPKLAAELAALMRQCQAADEAVRAAGGGQSVELTLRPMLDGETPGYYAPLAQMLFLPNFETRSGVPIWNGRTQG